MTSEKKVDFQKVFGEIEKMFPDAKVELDRGTPFQFLLAVILSAQATDKQVNKATKKFFKYIKTPWDILKHCQDAKDDECSRLQNQIKTIWLYKSKAKNILRLSKILAEISSQGEEALKQHCQSAKCREVYAKYGYIIPDKLEEFVKLPGVGMKTAKVVLNVLYWQDVVPVDTHIHRVANRLWWVFTKDPQKTSLTLEKLIPNQYKQKAHKLLVLFGRYHCKAQKPQCETCPLKDVCTFYLKTKRYDNSSRSAKDKSRSTWSKSS